MAEVQRRRTQLSMSDPGVGEIKVGVSQGGSFAQGLLDAASAATGIYKSVGTEIVENDKIAQANRALRGLMPSEDATTGGTRAHMLVATQNKMNETTARLKDDAATWQGTDAEWDQHVIQSRVGFEQETYGQYPELRDDKSTSKLITNMLMEQQPSVYAAKVGADLEKEHVARAQTLQTRITQATQGLDGSDLTRVINGELRETAKAMRLTPGEFEASIAQEAKARGASGDSRMLMATQGIMNAEGVSLYDRDASIRAATISAQRMDASLNQVQLSEDKFGIEQRYLAGESTDEEFLSSAANANFRTGGAAYSASEINSIRDAKIKAAAKGAKNTQFVSKILNGDGDIMALEDYSPEEVSQGIKATYAQSNAIVDAYAKNKGMDADSTEALRTQMTTNTMVNLAKAGFKDPVLTRAVGSFMSIGPEHLQSMKEEPAELTNMLNRWDTLPDSMKNSVVGDKESAFITNYQSARNSGQDVGQALDFAQKNSRDIKFSGQDVKDMAEAGKRAAADINDNSWFNPFSGPKYPDYIKQKMADEGIEVVRRFRKAGYSMEDAEKQANIELSQNYDYAGGTIIKGDRKMLAARLKVNSEDLGAQFQAYLQGNKQSLEDSAGGIEMKEMYFDIDQKRGTFVVRAGSGGLPVSSPKPLSELADYKWAEKVAKSSAAEKKEYQDRYNAVMGQEYNNPGMGRPGAVPEVATTLMNAIFPPAEAAAQTRSPEEIGKIQKDATFEQYLSQNENRERAGFDLHNRVFTPYDSDTKQAGTDTIAYGHLLTPEEKKNGFIKIDGKATPFTPGNSELNEEAAKALLRQDMRNHTPKTPGWKVGIDEVPGNVKRALIDTSFNMGPGFLSKNPTANEWFKKGDFSSGFLQLLTASNENGARSKGVLVRRASSYNLANPGDWPKISKVHVDDDGGMAVQFSGSIENLNPRMQAMIKDGWMVVKRGKAGSLHERSKAGEVSLQ